MVFVFYLLIRKKEKKGKMEGREGEEKEGRKEEIFIFFCSNRGKNTHNINLSSLLFLNVQLSSIRYIHIVVQPIPRTFPSCKTGTLCSLRAVPHCFLPQPPSPAMTVTTPSTADKWDHTASAFLRLAHFTRCYILKGWPCGATRRFFFPFKAEWKDPDAGKDCRREEKGTTEDEMAGWHHRLSGREFE